MPKSGQKMGKDATGLKKLRVVPNVLTGPVT
jgi:hypothetical protein